MTVTVITPVGPNWNPDHLRDTAHVLNINTTVTRWILACDRSNPAHVKAILESHDGIQDKTDRVHVIPSHTPGTAHARNTALAHADTPWVYALDADDLPQPCGVDQLVHAATGYTWAAGLAVDYDQTGQTISYTPPGHLAPFTTHIPVGGFQTSRDTTGIYPFLCSGATILNTEHTRQVGGWDTTLRIAQDISLIAAINSTQPGGWVNTTVLGYRKHPRSTTAAPKNPIEEAAAMTRILNRAAHARHEEANRRRAEPAPTRQTRRHLPVSTRHTRTHPQPHSRTGR